jgi:uncharacterized protein YheU (UPF0270 family)
MAQFLRVPTERLSPEGLQGLLEEFASRDGTDYGATETPLERRVAQLRSQLAAGAITLVFDAASETWDLLAADVARDLLGDDDTGDA